MGREGEKNRDGERGGGGVKDKKEREREGRRREKERPEIKIQSFRPVLHHADKDNGIPRYFLPVHGIFLRVNTPVFFHSLLSSLLLRVRVTSKRGYVPKKGSFEFPKNFVRRETRERVLKEMRALTRYVRPTTLC